MSESVTQGQKLSWLAIIIVAMLWPGALTGEATTGRVFSFVWGAGIMLLATWLSPWRGNEGSD